MKNILKLLLEEYKIRSLILLPLLVLSLNASAQDSLKNSLHFLSLKTEFVQIKDQFNYGLVFNGLNLNGRYTLEKSLQNSKLVYQPEFSFGANYNKGIGLAWGLVPIDFF